MNTFETVSRSFYKKINIESKKYKNPRQSVNIAVNWIWNTLKGLSCCSFSSHMICIMITLYPTTQNEFMNTIFKWSMQEWIFVQFFFIFCVFNFQFELTHTEAQENLHIFFHVKNPISYFVFRIYFFIQFFSTSYFLPSCYCCCCRGTWCSVDLKYYSFGRNVFSTFSY